MNYMFCIPRRSDSKRWYFPVQTDNPFRWRAGYINRLRDNYADKLFTVRFFEAKVPVEPVIDDPADRLGW